MDTAEAIYEAVMAARAKGFEEGIKAAREAVAATYDEDYGFPPRSIVLAAIDALLEDR